MAQAEPTSAHAYDSADLAFFDNVLDNLLEELATSDHCLGMNGSRDGLRRQLGARLFECTQAGERDYVAIRQRVLSIVLSGRSAPRAQP